MRTAFLIDGAFFLKRHLRIAGQKTPADTAKDLHRMCRNHLFRKPQSPGERERVSELYRIFYYDCRPLTKKAHDPLTGRAVDFSRTPVAIWRTAFLEELKKLRKVALRLGYLNDREGHWTVRPETMKQLLTRKRTIDEFAADDLKYEVRQKSVDMRLGIDIASLAFKKQVDQIVLVAGDSDFVPAAKLARREGIDFVLDPLWATISADLHEHIDGLRTVLPRPGSTAAPEAD